MSIKRSTLGLVAMLAVLAVTGCASTQRGPSEWDGLVRLPGTRLDASDLAAIQGGLAGIQDEMFREELTSGGYQFVAEARPDTLIVIPAIVDLVVTAPDNITAGRSRTYTANSGRMTLVLELRNSMTGEVLARVVDTRSGRGTGMMTVTNRVTNTADARRAIRIWAQALRGGLDSLHKGEG